MKIFNRASFVRGSAGAMLYGPDLGEWPAWAYDAQVVIAQEEQKVDDARMKAISRK